jgi:hypothetical protein
MLIMTVMLRQFYKIEVLLAATMIASYDCNQIVQSIIKVARAVSKNPEPTYRVILSAASIEGGSILVSCTNILTRTLYH